MTARRSLVPSLAALCMLLPCGVSSARAGEAAAAAAPGRQPVVASPIVDPMERLRQRLAERLAAGQSDNLSGKLDLRNSSPGAVAAGDSARERPAPRPSARLAAAQGGGAPATPRRAAADAPAAAGPVHAEAPHWAYEGAGGPAAWGSLQPEFALCARGERQSPIDIRDGLAVDLEPVRFDYQPGRFGVVDNGHTVQVNLAPGSSIDIGGRRYELVQFHFHRPSEERIDGRQFEMSVHLVHRDAQGRLAVVGLLLEKGPAQPVVQAVWNNLPLEKHEESTARTTIDPAGLLPADRRYYTYMGSLTTPPCSEGVQWIVMRAPVTAAPEQLELFGRLYPMNARPLQSAGGRRILQSN
ncbi:MAG: hypothetical protein AMXMBFR66_14220 [Pseudomonadota bacterium]